LNEEATLPRLIEHGSRKRHDLTGATRAKRRFTGKRWGKRDPKSRRISLPTLLRLVLGGISSHV